MMATDQAARIARAQPEPMLRPQNAVTLVLPYPVSANAYWTSRVVRSKKTQRNIVLTFPTHEAEQYKRDVAVLVRAAGVHQPIHGRVRVDIKLYPSRPLDWAKRARKDPDGWSDTVHCLDLDNARKVLNDALKDIAFDDDKWIKQDSGAVMEPDEHGARVVVTIAPIVREPIAPELFEA